MFGGDGNDAIGGGGRGTISLFGEAGDDYMDGGGTDDFLRWRRRLWTVMEGGTVTRPCEADPTTLHKRTGRAGHP